MTKEVDEHYNRKLLTLNNKEVLVYPDIAPDHGDKILMQVNSLMSNNKYIFLAKVSYPCYFEPLKYNSKYFKLYSLQEYNEHYNEIITNKKSLKINLNGYHEEWSWIRLSDISFEMTKEVNKKEGEISHD